ncbi:transglutaminase family protein [Pseudolabrys taiwanensis]|uniref:Transglutaminase family protein n=1 Tax=Pseudolabrys taiwanensis TaxID=331696 RepID=A0A345ZTN8_9HYPH|nr:transglutaminase family protein [Pseudolabrys taiwanensis]AXK80285.1 transglutaminase family protein [Pseudolabrys taiwanensis]
MIYDVRQVTTYHYDSAVTDAHHALRLTPIDRPGQRVHAAALDVTPAPVERREGRDFFGNRVTWIKLEQQHDVLSVRVAARIVVEPPQQPGETPAWEEVREAAVRCTDFSPEAPAHFLFASRVVSLDPEIREYAAASFPEGRPVLEGAVDLMGRIKADFVYEVGATTATTTPPMSFALRRGVCQDFSHVMISGLRSLGLPAAYVSGYLRTARPGDEVKLEGADAMHAWVLVWCGDEAGWIGLDPTNDMPAGTDHLVLAIGRDYADVAPIDGVIVAAGGQRLEVAVQVTPVG